MEDREERTERKGEGQGEGNFPIRLTWWKVGLVFLCFWSILPWIPRLVQLFLGKNAPVSTEELGRWRQALSTVDRLESIPAFAIYIASIVLYFRVAQTGGATERRRSRGEIFTGILNLQIISFAIASVLVVPSAENLEPGLVMVAIAGRLLVGVVWCLAAFHMCEGRVFRGLVGVCVPLLLSAALNSRTIVFDGYLRTVIFAALAGPLLGFWWQVSTLQRSGSGFVLFPTGLWPAIRRTGRVLIPVAGALWFLTPGFREFALTIFGPHLFDSGRFHPALWRISWTPAVLWTVYLAPLVFLPMKQDVFTRRTRYLVPVWAVLCCLYGALITPLSEAAYYHVTGAGISDISYYLRYLALNGARVAIWNVFVPLCLLRWWVRGHFLRPLLVVPAAFFVAFGRYVVVPQLTRTPGWIVVVLQAAAMAVVAGTLLIPDVRMRRGDGDWSGLTQTNTDADGQAPTDPERSDPVPRGDTTVPVPETTDSGENPAKP